MNSGCPMARSIRISCLLQYWQRVLTEWRTGAIRVRGDSIMGLATHKLVGAGVAYVPQVDNIVEAAEQLLKEQF